MYKLHSYNYYVDDARYLNSKFSLKALLNIYGILYIMNLCNMETLGPTKVALMIKEF